MDFDKEIEPANKGIDASDFSLIDEEVPHTGMRTPIPNSKRKKPFTFLDHTSNK